MDTQAIGVRDVESLDTEYKYIVHVRGLETFRNVMRQEGINIPETSNPHTSFTSTKRLDMKSYKENGVVWSYSVIRVIRNEDVIDEG
jgi:hypothetical protein